MAEANEERGKEEERGLTRLVARLAEEEFREGGAGIRRFGERLLALAEGNCSIIALAVFSPERDAVAQYARDARGLPCAMAVPLDTIHDFEHPPGAYSHVPVGCRVLPVIVRGKQVAAVVLHLDRDWRADRGHVTAAVQRTALRLAPVFGAFYLLMGVLLFVASRAASRWRAQAASAHRIEALGAIADGINHEIRNPLNAVGLSLQYLERRHPETETKEVVEMARREAARIASTLDTFARFTRVNRLTGSTQAVASRVLARAEAAGVALDLAGEVEAWLDSAKIDDALDAILDLIARQLPEGARATAALSRRRGEWLLAVEADAPALKAEAFAHLFDPYLRCRAHDIGRGLALARAVFQAHGGDLQAVRKPQKIRLEGTALVSPSGVSE